MVDNGEMVEKQVLQTVMFSTQRKVSPEKDNVAGDGLLIS